MGKAMRENLDMATLATEKLRAAGLRQDGIQRPAIHRVAGIGADGEAGEDLGGGECDYLLVRRAGRHLEGEAGQGPGRLEHGVFDGVARGHRVAVDA